MEKSALLVVNRATVDAANTERKFLLNLHERGFAVTCGYTLDDAIRLVVTEGRVYQMVSIGGGEMPFAAAHELLLRIKHLQDREIREENRLSKRRRRRA